MESEPLPAFHVVIHNNLLSSLSQIFKLVAYLLPHLKIKAIKLKKTPSFAQRGSFCHEKSKGRANRTNKAAEEKKRKHLTKQQALWPQNSTEKLKHII